MIPEFISMQNSSHSHSFTIYNIHFLLISDCIYEIERLPVNIGSGYKLITVGIGDFQEVMVLLRKSRESVTV
jgi:hypothetical protein